MERNAGTMGRGYRSLRKPSSSDTGSLKPIVKTFQELYSGLQDVTANPELKRLIKKAKRQQSIRDRRQQLERSRKRQQLAAANKDKSNNWRRLHGLPAQRKVKKTYKKH